MALSAKKFLDTAIAQGRKAVDAGGAVRRRLRGDQKGTSDAPRGPVSAPPTTPTPAPTAKAKPKPQAKRKPAAKRKRAAAAKPRPKPVPTPAAESPVGPAPTAFDGGADAEPPVPRSKSEPAERAAADTAPGQSGPEVGDGEKP